jgi:hypothetical protein
MWRAFVEDQQSEVFVHRHEDSCLGGSPSEYGPIARVGAARLRLNDVVTLGNEPSRQPAADAPVKKKSHSPSIRTASNRSCATTAWA